MLGGGSGITSSVAVKGNRMANMGERTGLIVDLAEERIYQIDDMRRKEYRVMTFAEFRQMLEDMKKQAEEQMASMPPEEQAAMKTVAENVEFEANVKETGATKQLAGHAVRQVIVTVAMKAKGKTLEDGGGLALTNDMWLAQRIPAMEELATFSMRFAKAVFGPGFTSGGPQASVTLNAFIPGFAQVMERMAAETRTLTGTPLSWTSVLESVKSAEQMKAGAQAPPQTGGGIGGILGRGLMRGRGQAQQRTKMLTTTHEVLSIGTTVSDAEVNIPPGFKQK
jgi:hypothetical protein